jgi:hypothetical protein
VKSSPLIAGEEARRPGWETQGRDLVAASATLRRKRDDATLTIFVKALDADRAAVQLMSSGLAWEDKK